MMGLVLRRPDTLIFLPQTQMADCAAGRPSPAAAACAAACAAAAAWASPAPRLSHVPSSRMSIPVVMPG